MKTIGGFMISVAEPIIDSEEIDAVNKVLHSGMIAQGPVVTEFEEAFAKYCGTKYAVAVNSGTAAIHAALFAAGVKENDEVITTPFSFIATINPILMVGASPVLVDIEPGSFNLDVSKIEQAVTDKTKAILPVHLYGQTIDWDELHAIAKKHGLKVIEDACQAVGAEYKGFKAGNLGDAGCFSLYATKNIMCGEGGVVTTNNEDMVTLMKSFRQHGMTGPYQYAHLGFNYRMMDLQGAIAKEQLKKVDSFNKARNKNAELLRVGLADVKGLVLPKTGADKTHVFHQFTIRVTAEFGMNREELQAKLKERGIIAGIYYPKPLHAYPHIQELGFKLGDFPIAEQAAAEVLSLPVHPRVSDEDVQTIINSIKDIANGI